MISPRFVLPALVTVLVGMDLPNPQQQVVAAQMVVAGTFSAVYGDAPPGSGLPPVRRYILSSGNLQWKPTIRDAVLAAAGGAQFLNGKTVEVTGSEVSVGRIEVESIGLAGESALAAAFDSPAMAIAGPQKFRTIPPIRSTRQPATRTKSWKTGVSPCLN